MRHTYSAGGVVINQNGQMLLINEGANFWGIPKGRQEAGESLLETARREIEEEAGLSKISLVDKIGTYERHPNNFGQEDVSELKHITLFLFKVNNPPRDLSNREKNEIRWTDPGRAITLLTHPKDREFLRLNLGTIQTLVEKHSFGGR